MIPASDAVRRAHNYALADFREACADLGDTIAQITDTARHLQNWPHDNAVLIDGLPPDWPDLERLVALIAAVRRGKEAVLSAWNELPPAGRASLEPPGQALSAS